MKMMFVIFLTSAICFPLVVLIVPLAAVMKYLLAAHTSPWIDCFAFSLFMTSPAFTTPSGKVPQGLLPLVMNAILILSVMFIFFALSAMRRSVTLQELIPKDLVAHYSIKFLTLKDMFMPVSCLSVYRIQKKPYGLLSYFWKLCDGQFLITVFTCLP